MSLQRLQLHMVYRGLLKYTLIHYAMQNCLCIIRAKGLISSERPLLPFCRNLIFRKHRSKLYCSGYFSWSLSRLRLIYVLAYEATKANRNLLAVYIGELNQQLCKMKQDGKQLKNVTKTNTVLATEVAWTTKCYWGCPTVSEWAVKCSFIKFWQWDLAVGGWLWIWVFTQHARLHLWICGSALEPVCMMRRQ